MALGWPSVSNSPYYSNVTHKFPRVRAGIRDRTTAFIVSENSWPSFMYENYEADANNLERGLFKSKLLLMVSGLDHCSNWFITHCIAGLQGYIHIPLLGQWGGWWWWWCWYHRKQPTRPETFRSSQSEDVCCLHHRYEEGDSSHDCVCSLSGKHQYLLPGLKLKFNSADPIRTFQRYLLAHRGRWLRLPDFLEQHCGLLWEPAGSSCTSQGEGSSWVVDTVSR